MAAHVLQQLQQFGRGGLPRPEVQTVSGSSEEAAVQTCARYQTPHALDSGRIALRRMWVYRADGDGRKATRKAA